MAGKKIMAVMSNKTEILSVIDGKMDKVGGLIKKTLWMPASAGMTMSVGGASH